MAVLNITPDSFSDGGKYCSAGDAVCAAMRMIEEGADIIDVGGESSRPGAAPVPAAEEARRVLPVIETLAGRAESAIISIDTTKSEIAEQALKAGAHIVNDISAAESDPRMPEVMAHYSAGAVLMHKKGDPRTMQADPSYEDVVAEVGEYLETRVCALTAAGVPRENVAIDPGICFGKTVGHNLALLANLNAVNRANRPVVIGVSRKSFLGKITGRDIGDRLPASLSAMVYAALRGAAAVRVHDARETRDALKIIESLRAEEKN